MKKDMVAALKALGAGEFAQQAQQMLAVLGYNSERDTGQTFNSAEEFIIFAKEHNPNKTNAKLTKEEERFCDAAKSLTVISQFTNENTNDKRDNFDIGFVKSFLFVAVELSGNHHSRSDYASFTRQINKYLSMPTVVLFVEKHKKYLTIAFVERRQNKQAPERDVLGKVSLIHEINLADPHRAHIDILRELSFPSCEKWIKEKKQPQNFDSLLNAWIDILNTEALNKKFYADILDWFDRIVYKETATVKFPLPKPGQDNPPTDEQNRQAHAIRLITRLMFVWFMKEKRLVASDLFFPPQLETLLKDFKKDFSVQNNNSSYYRAILQNLFFATLNAKISNRGFSKQNNSNHRVPLRFHYKEEMQQPEKLVKLFNETPFVNGGLFDCLDSDEATREGGCRVDCFSDNKTHSRDLLTIPDRLFFDEKGIIRIFKKYKFTVQESTPIEREVALDPELLGKVFENLLEAKNLESTNMRRRTGSYYTPRRVVDYMVGESLLECLATKVPPTDGNKTTWRKKLLRLLNEHKIYEDVENTLDKEEKINNTEKESIVHAIADIKIIDPAVGSGAFPMSVLHRLTLILRRLDVNNRLWKKIQVEKATQRAQRIFESEKNKDKRAEELDEINAIFDKYKNSDFGRKLYLIQNCIYGADIQTEAIQIAKLRFFISLAIEQNANEDLQDNYGFKPLPNLETRFVAADTVIGKEKQLSFTDSEVETIKKKIEHNRESYFHANTLQTKRDLKNEYKQYLMELAEVMLRKFNFNEPLIKRIVAWNPFDANSTANWFDSDYMFGIKGFDLVIGNPPYVQLQANNGRLRKKYEHCQYETFSRTGDIYCLFYELGRELLHSDGHLIYISPNNYMRTAYGRELRTFLRRQTTIKTIIDFGELPVFEAGTNPSILLTQNKQTAASAEFTAAVIKENKDIDDLQATMRKKSFAMETADLSDENWTLVPKEVYALIYKMQSNGKPMNNYVNGKMHRGITTGLNEAFMLNASQRQELIDKDPRSAELIKPVIRTKDMRQWYAEYRNLYIIFTECHTNIDGYPEIKRHLESYKPQLLDRASPATEFWYALQVPTACHDAFHKPKIIWSNIALSLYASVDYKGFYVRANAYACFADNNEYLLGILNSQLLDFYYRHHFYSIGHSQNRGRMQFDLLKMQRIPIADADEQEQEEIADYVKCILDDPKGEHVESIKTKIDALVYRLYGLNKKEIALVEKWQKMRLENERKAKK